MDRTVGFFVLALLLTCYPSSSETYDTLSEGSSLSVEKSNDLLISANGIFSAGFYQVGNNTFCFAIWFTKSWGATTVWMANRDQPVNGRGSKLSLLRNGNLLLTDAGKIMVWMINTVSTSSARLQLLNTGNLVLYAWEKTVIWQSFDSPTDTLLPHQILTKDTSLISSRSQSNYSSGFYKLFFDSDNVIRLLFNGTEVSSIYWPDPSLVTWDAGRSTYNNSRIAVFDSLGYYRASDDLEFRSADFGAGPQRRLALDFDGNLRMYSLEETRGTWSVSWQAISQPCQIHGICGPNSLCSYTPAYGRGCSCMPGFKIVNSTDWSYGCAPETDIACNQTEVGFFPLPHVQLYGYDYGHYPNYTYESCENLCLQLCKCKAFLLNFSDGLYGCYPKTLLLNGFSSPNYPGTMYLKLPKASLFPRYDPLEEFTINCSGNTRYIQLDTTYRKGHENGSLKFLLWFAYVLGVLEGAIVLLVWLFLFWVHHDPVSTMQGYILVANGFKRFSYAELKKATRGFTQEIGRGGGGVVYKGVLLDRRVAAIKRLKEANQGEAEFLAEVSTIGRLNHMNLIETWGYCIEGKHRLLVYEYMEHGSLAQKLSSNTLDWEKRFQIALGTARGLAYLHEECLEWVLHCDVKPQNILLDSNYQPKVADFGMSKLRNRGGLDNSSFSRIRGTRGYMAPEWVFNLPITSKVDVYSYGIVVLEMVTGKSPTAIPDTDAQGETEQRGLIKWVRDRMNGIGARGSWIEDILDPVMQGECDLRRMEILIGVALECVEEDRDSRPTMSQIVEKLMCPEERPEEDGYLSMS
ncbi:putative receptor protein kinase ZmPK1 [Vitis vinifera]|uniref:Receptor-like serine/threonine-protein kinase n=1 Tax=Vitis vinifera TaxID=29760 RepID=F6GZX1_VITVI|nr:putative receptor protein kinase ZmPK1 [Vitis vinifera]